MRQNEHNKDTEHGGRLNGAKPHKSGKNERNKDTERGGNGSRIKCGKNEQNKDRKWQQLRK